MAAKRSVSPLLFESSIGSSSYSFLMTTTGGGLGSCLGCGEGGAPLPPLRDRVVSSRRRGMLMMMTTSSSPMRVTSTKFTAKISSPTRRHPELYTGDSKAMREMNTPSARSAPLPSRMYSPSVWPGRFTISTICTLNLTFCGKNKHYQALQ